MPAENERLGNWIKMHRARLNMTQADLADAVSVSRKTINTVENGVFTPSTLLALKIARALGMSIDDLFFLTDEAQQSRLLAASTPPGSREA